MSSKHYKHMKLDVAEFCEINSINFLEGNVIKYVCRHEQKNGKDDILKAMHYLELILKYKYDDIGENDIDAVRYNLSK